MCVIHLAVILVIISWLILNNSNYFARVILFANAAGQKCGFIVLWNIVSVTIETV